MNFYGYEKASDMVLKRIYPKYLNLNNSEDSRSTLSVLNNKIIPSTVSRSLNVNFNSKGLRCFSGVFPNLLGKGETLSINFKSNDDYNVGLTIPHIFGNGLNRTKIELCNKRKEMNNTNFFSKRLELGMFFDKRAFKVGVEKVENVLMLYNQYNFGFLDLFMKVKSGITVSDKKEPFLKIVGIKEHIFEFNRLFFQLKISLGRLFGKTHLNERFILGPEVKGYKSMSIGPHDNNLKRGGKSFGVINSKLGFNIGNIEIFAFGDIGVNTVKGLRECWEIIKINDGSTCMGKSIGVGASFKNDRNICVFYSVPFVKNDETEQYGFNLSF